MSGKAFYNEEDIQVVMDNSETITRNIISTSDNIDEIVNGVDKRVYDYFNFFKDLKDKSEYLRAEEENSKKFGDWMHTTYDDYLKTKSATEALAGANTPSLDLSEQYNKFPSINVDPSSFSPYDITSEAWESLSTEEKKAIEAKLKELGFTDEEIQAIKDGNASVSKVTLDKLNSALEKLNSDGTDVRKVILSEYGFDIFNEDGTVNRDKLALALLMDGKDPNDNLDLVKLLKEKYGIDLLAESTSNNNGGSISHLTTTEVNTDISPSSTLGGNVNDVHTGGGYGANSNADKESNDFTEIENILNGDKEKDDDSLLDGLGNLSGSLLNKKDGLGIKFNKDGKGGGAAAAAAGIAGLGAAATAAGFLAKKKKEKDAILDDDDDDDDDDIDEDIDEDKLLEDVLDDENIDDDDLKKKNKKKDWLYGLGIGLAGAGLAAGLLAKDDDDDEDDD